MMTVDEQLEKWVNGESIHNDERDECCPDFSCCDPNLLTSEEERRKFYESNEEIRLKMLHIFFARFLSSMECENIYIVGDEANNYETQ